MSMSGAERSRRYRERATAPGEHLPWSPSHRSACPECRDAYSTYERARNPAKDSFRAPRGFWTPDTLAARRDWLLDAGAADLRRQAGISAQTVATALGVSQVTVCYWETGRRVPVSDAGAAYCRFIAGLARHEEVPAEPAGVPVSRRRNAPGLAA